MIKVYHRNETRFGLGAKGDLLRDYTLVAEVLTDDLETAFEKTNTIDSPWWKNEGLAFSTPTRSTSVGDVMSKDGEVFVVQGAGFLPWDEVTSEKAYGNEKYAPDRK